MIMQNQPANNAWLFHIALAIWILTAVSVFAESYPDRPTAFKMRWLVKTGTECAKGVNERCYATQYATNTYQVSPFTNNSCWYLDQSLMGQIAEKARSLVPFYVDPDTVYQGTTNISMLTVAEVWEELDIGNNTSQFTQIFPSGTNAAVYGDSPWRIKEAHLDERYYVLNYLQKRLLGSYSGNYFPEVVRTAKVSGQGTTSGGENCHVWYTLYGTDLGPANGTVYNIEIDARNFNGAGGADYISLGWGGTPWGFNSSIFQMTLDTSGGSGISTFSAALTLDANPDVIKIWNCMLGSASDPGNTSINYSDSTVLISANLDRAYQAVANFGFYAVINFPFQYCK